MMIVSEIFAQFIFKKKEAGNFETIILKDER